MDLENNMERQPVYQQPQIENPAPVGSDEAFLQTFNQLNHQLANDRMLNPEDRTTLTEIRDEMLIALIWELPSPQAQYDAEI